MAQAVRGKRIGGVLAALFVALGASGILAIGLLAPPNPGAGRWGLSGSPSLSTGGASVDPFETTGQVVNSGTQQPAAGNAPPESFVTHPSAGLPAAGEATGYGCSAALEYLNAYAAPGFTFECPGNAGGHQAMTQCVSSASRCGIERLIVIADPCPNAYMNEASNSWALSGASDAPLDPYGSCG